MGFQVQDTSYSGTYSPFFIQRATYGMDTVRKGLVHIVSGIGKIHTIKRLDYDNPLKPRMAVPTANNAHPFTMDGRVLAPKSVDVYEEFNPRDLEENDLAEALASTILDREVPQGLQEQMVQLVLNRAGEKYETGLWMASLNYANNPAVDENDARYQLQFFDGYMKRLVSDALVNLSSISPAVITISNIQVILDDLIQQATIKQKALIVDPMRFERMKFLMSPVTAAIYTAYLRTGANFKGLAFSDGSIPRWGEYKVESVAGMPDNTILFLRATDEATISNLYAGMNSMSDWELKIARTKAADETFFIQGKWKWDVNYGWPMEIFMFTTLTAASFIAA